MSNQNLPKVRTIYYGMDTVWFMDQRAWTKLPTEIKTPSPLTVFKNISSQRNEEVLKLYDL